MKKKTLEMLAVLMALALALCSCGGSASDDTSDDSAGSAAVTDTQAVVKTIDEIDTEDMDDLPLQLESVTLFEDGTVRVVPTGDVKEIAETNDELTDGAAYPFAEEGDEARKVKDIYLVRFGNGGYRTVIALMDDGSLSALSASNLIEEHILVVMPNVSNRDDFVSVEEIQGEDGFSVIGTTEDGEEVELDFSLEF